MSINSISNTNTLPPGYSLGVQQQQQTQKPGSATPDSAQSAPVQGSGTATSTDVTSRRVSTQITKQAEQPNANGTLTVTTTFADGTTKTSLRPNPLPVTTQSLLSGSNTGQFAALLSAQEQSQSGSDSSYAYTRH